MHQVHPNCQKYPIYTKYLPLRSKFWSVLLYFERFPRHHTFYNPHDLHGTNLVCSFRGDVSENEKKNGKNPKIEMSQFFKQLW